MHRSGTSAVTRSLPLFGCNLGNDLLPAFPDNPKGLFEDNSVLDINNKLLDQLEITWDSLGMAWDHIENSDAISRIRSDAIRMLSRNLETFAGLWGFKDPRTCRLLPFWLDVFDAVQCDVSFIVSLRNPASVAASLKTRNNIPAEKSYYLWLQHVIPAVTFTTGFKRIVVDYDNLIEHPHDQLSRLSSFLNLQTVPRQDPKTVEYVDRFLDPSLRNTCFDAEYLRRDVRSPAAVATLYNLLRKTADDKISLDGTDISNFATDQYNNLRSLAPLFDYVCAVERSQREYESTIENRNETIDKLIELVNKAKSEAVRAERLNKTYEQFISKISSLSEACSRKS
jgi:hypothetical protein